MNKKKTNEVRTQLSEGCRWMVRACTVQILMGPLGTTQWPRGSELSCLAEDGR